LSPITINGLLNGIYNACVHLSEFYKRPILLNDLLVDDQDEVVDLLSGYFRELERRARVKAEELAPKFKMKAVEVYDQLTFPQTAYIRKPIKQLRRAFGKRHDKISGAKDATRKLRVIKKRVDDLDIEIATKDMYLTKQQFVEFYRALGDPELQALACFAVSTATRRDGIMKLKVGDIKFPYSVRTFEKRSPKRPTGMWDKFLTDFASKALKRWLRIKYNKPDDFEDWDKLPQIDRVFSKPEEYYRSEFRRAYDQIGMMGVTHPFHILRHTFVQWMVRTKLSKNYLAIAQLGGWDDVSTMVGVYFASEEALRAEWMGIATGKIVEPTPEPFEAGLEGLGLVEEKPKEVKEEKEEVKTT
jgi:integrase